jgi:MFS transporter, PPP family, 3-phenylpropionic acid transporter
MRSREGQGFAIRAAAFGMAIFVGVGIYLPFFPLWLAGKGLGGTEIATIVAAPLFARILFMPLLAAAAEKLPDLRVASVLYALAAALFLSTLAFVGSYWPILLLASGAFLFWNTLPPLLDAVILAGVRQHRIDYARVRLWGSVGFVAGSSIAALALGHYASDAVLTLLVVCFFAGSAVALVVPRVSVGGIVAEPYGLRRAFADPVLRRALLAGNLVLAGNGAYYAFGSLYWQAHGFGRGTIGALWALSVVAEVALFWVAKLLPGWGARRFLIAGALGALVRWSLFPLATRPAAALVLQCLHALTFAGAHLGVMMAIGAVAVPGHTARLQGVHQFVGGLMLAVTTLSAGPLYRLAPALPFACMAALAVPALILAFGLRRGLQPQSAVLGGATSAPE